MPDMPPFIEYKVARRQHRSIMSKAMDVLKYCQLNPSHFEQLFYPFVPIGHDND